MMTLYYKYVIPWCFVGTLIFYNLYGGDVKLTCYNADGNDSLKTGQQPITLCTRYLHVCER